MLKLRANSPRGDGVGSSSFTRLKRDFMRFHSIRSKILWVSGLMILCGFAAVIALNTYTAFSHAKQQQLQQLRQRVLLETRPVQHLLNQAYLHTQALANAASVYPAAKPAQGRELLSRQVEALLPANPDALGYFVEWEPKVFDSRDAEFAGREGQSADGRFGVYWYRKDDKIDVIYGGKVNGEAYYEQPRKTGKPYLVEPYLDPDVKVLMATVSISEAARLTGKSRTTLHRLIKAGELSTCRGERNAKMLDTSELLRVFGAFAPVSVEQEEEQVSGQRDTVTSDRNEQVIYILKQEIEHLNTLLASRDSHIDSLKQAMLLLENREEKRQNTTRPRAWWRFWQS